MTADAFATAFMVIGLEKGIELAEKYPEIKVYFIYADEKGENQIYMSEDFESHLSELKTGTISRLLNVFKFLHLLIIYLLFGHFACSILSCVCEQ